MFEGALDVNGRSQRMPAPRHETAKCGTCVGFFSGLDFRSWLYATLYTVNFGRKLMQMGRAVRFRRPFWLTFSAIPVFGLIAALLATLALFDVARTHQQRRDKTLFEAETAKFINGMRQSMTASEMLLQSAAGLVTTHPDLSLEDWRIFVDATDLRRRFPGFQGLALLRYGDAHAGLTNTSVVAADATELGRSLTVRMLEPASWRDPMGLTERDAGRQIAMARARDLDAPARTRLVHFPATATVPEQVGFVVYAAVYGRSERWETVPQRRSAVIGYVVMPFAMPALVTGLMQGRYEEARPYFRIEIFDGRPSEGVKWFDSVEQEGFTPPSESRFANEAITERFGTEMGYRFTSLPAYEALHTSWLPDALLGSGVLFSALLYGLLAVLHHNEEVADVARKDNAALRLELAHRVKNVLSVVQSLANRSLPGDGEREADSPQQFADRLDALARAHTLILENSWLGTEIGELVRSELAPLATRATAMGPKIALSPQVSQSLALVIHEMAVDAVSRDVAAIHITWASADSPSEPAVEVFWREEGAAEEYGPRFAQQIAAHGFGAKATVTRIAGVSEHVFRVPLA